MTHQACLWRLRASIYVLAARHGRLPDVAALSAASKLPPDQVTSALRRLHAERLLVIDPVDARIVMAHPLAGFQSRYRFESGDKCFDAPCAWDVLALPSLLDRAGTVHAFWAEDGQAWQARADAQRLDAPAGVVHFSVTAQGFWDDIGFT
ncbi:MAG: hypothetical protein KDK91_17545 [Gammaproteobacteria bacterium]|nr:hypothetical protein [Gammaproteobacteria bacterium]